MDIESMLCASSKEFVEDFDEKTYYMEMIDFNDDGINSYSDYLALQSKAKK